MGYYDHDEDQPAPDAPTTAQQVLSLCVRLLGMTVLVAGVWTAVIVITEAWGLYREPARIERFADAIERGSNLDKAFAPRRESEARTSAVAPGPGLDSAGSPSAGTAAESGIAATPDRQYYSVRLSYFAAWFVGLALLVVLGVLAMSAISTGGQLALYNMQVKRLSRQIVQEVRRMKKAA